MAVVKVLNCYFYANILCKSYAHHIRCFQSSNNPFERQLNIGFLELLSTTKLLKFKICKKEKVIISNLEKVKKEKFTSLVFTRNLLMKTIFTEVHFLSREKRSGDGQAAIKYKMRSRAMQQVALIIMLEKSIFLIQDLVLHPLYFIFLVLHPQLLQKV